MTIMVGDYENDISLCLHDTKIGESAVVCGNELLAACFWNYCVYRISNRESKHILGNYL